MNLIFIKKKIKKKDDLYICMSTRYVCDVLKVKRLISKCEYSSIYRWEWWL